MLIRLDELEAAAICRLNGGEGTVAAKMYRDGHNKIMTTRIPAGASIGMHCHTSSSEINFVLAGHGKAVCDGQEETLAPGDCHYCPKGASHQIWNTEKSDFILFTVVPEQ
ncbi:MAG: cupin domain-containing protein [Oscillospiraceae bacterium]|nr:cupin domain-containing protein [Oscillospiraceae bacterium]